MKPYLNIAIIMFFVLSSCRFGTNKSVSNSGIPSEILEEIKILDQRVLNSVIKEDVTELKSLMSSELLNLKGLNVEDLIKKVSPLFKISEYQVIDQFYLENSTTGLSNSVFSGIKGDDVYQISIKSMNRKNLISLILPFGDKNKFFILNVYGKYKDGWKLNIIQFGQYEINGMTAPELYAKSKDDYEKGFLIDAINSMFLNSKILRPSNYFQYVKEQDMNAFSETLLEEVNEKYKFPITLEKIESTPQIINIYPKEIDEGYFPMVGYVTSLDMRDTVKLGIENEKVRKEVVKLFPGINKNKNYIFYTAFSQIPDGETTVKTYGFVQRIKQDEG